MAVADLKPGTVITEAHLGLDRMPNNELSKYPGMLLGNRGILGRVVKSYVRAGTRLRCGFDNSHTNPLAMSLPEHRPRSIIE